MKKTIKNKTVLGLALALFALPTVAADNLLVNPSFESGNVIFTIGTFTWIDGWFIFDDYTGPDDLPQDRSPLFSVPTAGAQDGDLSLKLFNVNPGSGQTYASSFSGDFGNQNIPVQPGDEVYAAVQLLTDQALVDGIAFRGMKIVFFDANGRDIAPSAVSKGTLQANCAFPGIEGDPILGSATDVGVWQKAQVQGVAASDQNQLVCADVINAPLGAETMRMFLFNFNFTGSAAPIFFDNAFLGILQPDDDSDRIENRVDSDPITVSAAFSDGTTSGIVESDTNGILAIDDAALQGDGISIVSDPGNGSPARVRVCDSTASLSIRPSSELVVTCGSVILAVAPGSEPVTMEIQFNGEPATVEVTPENTVTFEPEVNTISVASAADNPEPVVVSTGNTTISIGPGETASPDGISGISIDVKPGSDPNCFNVDGHGVIPVAVLGSPSLDVSDIDQTSLSFGGLDVRTQGNGEPLCGIEDTNVDGFLDLVCHFEDSPDNWNPDSDVSSTLTGELADQTDFSGSDSICLVP